MKASHLRPWHIGQKFQVRRAGAQSLEGGLSDYMFRKNLAGQVDLVTVYINGDSGMIQPDHKIAPIEDATT